MYLCHIPRAGVEHYDIISIALIKNLKISQISLIPCIYLIKLSIGN